MTEVVANLQALRNVDTTVMFGNELCFVKGHTFDGDGGGGLFMWSTMPPYYGTGTYAIDNNGTVIKTQSTTQDKGRWLRQYDGHINVLYFGAFGKTQDYTAAFQNAIDFAWMNAQNDPEMKGSVVYIPNGSYRINTLILKSGISIIGENIDRTVLQTTVNHTADYMLKTQTGPTFLNMENITLYGRNETNAGGMLLKDGIWNSSFKNIKIFNFGGHGLFLDTVQDSPLPNQFNTFENIRISKMNDFSHCLKITGQTGQTTFINCNFDGYKSGTPSRFPKGHNVNISHTGSTTTAILSFINCSFQEGDYGIYLNYVENVNIDTCWFENVGVSITLNGTEYNSCRDITVQNCRFANASGYGSLVVSPDNIKGGQCISVANSFVNVYNNYVAVSDPNSPNVSKDSSFIFAENNRNGGIAISDNVFQDNKLGLTHGIVQTISNGLFEIDCARHKFVNVSYSQTAIATIKSSISATETITIKAVGSISFSSSRNINLLGKSTLALNAGDVAVFMKADVPTGLYLDTFQLISVLRAAQV